MGIMASLFGDSERRVRVHVRLGRCERGAPQEAGGGVGGFGLHVWGSSAAASTAWETPLEPAGEDWYGLFFDVPLVALDDGTGAEGAEGGGGGGGGGGPSLGLLLHRGEDKRACLELASAEDVAGAEPEIWFGHGDGAERFATAAPDPSEVPSGDLASGGARAHWLQEGLIAWRSPTSAGAGAKVRLLASTSAKLEDGGAGGVRNFDRDEEGGPFELELIEGGLPADLAAANPYLKGCAALRVPGAAHVRALCRRQLALELLSAEGESLDCTGVQIGPVLDQLFNYSGPLGCFPASASQDFMSSSGKRPRFGGAFRRTAQLADPVSPASADDKGDGVMLALWAPSAQTVSVNFFDSARGPKAETVAMERSNDGVWRAQGPKSWWRRYYTYAVTAYHPIARKVVSMETPDPYSRACSADAERTMACDLATWETAVPGESFSAWRGAPVPPLAKRGDATVYELHIRDFSASDETVTAEHRGKYLAFEQEGSRGDLHLRKLAAAGITHVQLLPSYDFGTVPERKEDQREPSFPDNLPPDSELPQEAAMEAADVDGFNWGYDPVLYNVPEGSYASDPDGGPRVLEHRRMVAALHRKGLRVVVDVVYNHTLASGPEGRCSVLDKCVPGYYYRRSESGAYENSTCMNNTAGERAMMARLVVDSVLHWTKEYLVDGFRFDLMGHIPLSVMQRCRAALDALTIEKDGIDGSKVLMYGEGWEFGEVAGDQRGRMAVQRNLAGTTLGSFNDRVRDAVLGGSPFVDPRIQGFSTGLVLRPWPEEAAVPQGDAERQAQDLGIAADKIRVALAASLGRFVLAETCDGVESQKASEVHGGGVAYTGMPEEIINYVSAHDNETLYDNTVWKMPPSLFSPQERMRANWLCSAVVAFAHGVPFFHAGDEVLRSKSLDRDSYNSGDRFNVLDFSGKKSSFGAGLPPKNKNGEKWDMMRPLLRDASLRPTEAMAAATTAKFCEHLRVRRSTPLLGLVDAEDVCSKVDFPGCGANQVPGVIVMQVRNGPSASAPHDLLCPNLARIVVVLSARLEETRIPVPTAAAADGAPKVGASALRLHPLQAKSEDEPTRSARLDGAELVVPPQAAVVFVEPLPGKEGWTGE